MAVLTYLRRILESVDHPDMINLILHYLLALPDVAPSALANARSSVSAARKRKSVDLATMMAAQSSDLAATPLLFSLVDLILACLRSQSQQTIHVTLQLVSAILKRHHRYAIPTLLHTESVRSESSRRTVGAHEQELEFLMTLAGLIGGEDNFDEIYENILRDTTVRLEGHPCSLNLVAPKITTSNHKLPPIPQTLPGAPHDVQSHTLRPDDPVLNIILDRFDTFFINPVETNLSLTDAIFDLAVCGFMNIEGWFLRNPRVYTYDEDESTFPASPGDIPTDISSPAYAEYEKTQSIKQCRRRPQWTDSSLPRLLTTLQSLVDQIGAYRQSIPRFDDLLQQRREAFQMSDAEPALPPAPPSRSHSNNPSPATLGPSTPIPIRDRSTDNVRSGSPAPKPTGLEGFAQRILGELGTPSRSGSPRGRKERSTAISGTPLSVPPKEFPFNLETPSRSTPAGRGLSPTPRGRGEMVVGSQVKAFEAIDQSLLARRVGISVLGGNDQENKAVEPIPLTFDKAGGGETKMSSPVIPDEIEDGADGEVVTETGTGTGTPVKEGNTATVSHVLTNVILLQNFLFELASLVQVRAGLFDEVRFA